MTEINHDTQDQAFGAAPLLLTEDEIATVGGGAGSPIAAAGSLGFMAVAGGPIVAGMLAGAMVVNGAILIWNGVKSTFAK